MASEYLKRIDCGEPLPFNNPHAVSVSLPALSDVIGYEEGDPQIINKMRAGYPRFRMNNFLTESVILYRERKGTDDKYEVLPLSSFSAVKLLMDKFGEEFSTDHNGHFPLIKIEKTSAALPGVKSFLQNTGIIPSSRQAEDFLIEEGKLKSPYEEEVESRESALEIILETLSDAYSCNSGDIILANGGMNAVYSVFESIRGIQSKAGRTIFVQFGWMYLDTISILKNFGTNYTNVSTVEELEALLRARGNEVAALFLEIPNNPFVRTPDLPKISGLLKQYDVPLIVDGTVGTPYNVEVLTRSDIVIESLTKYACGNADLLMGAIVLNRKSEFSGSVAKSISEMVEPPYIRELQRLAFEIKGYRERMGKISANTAGLADYLSGNPKIKKLYWALGEDSSENYKKLMMGEGSVAGMISIVFDKPLQNYYDRLRIAQGPSLGTEFTLGMPYFYMAHYDLLKTTEGRKYLSGLGIDPELIRISVGTEPLEELIVVFEDLFKAD
ncbi:MAG: PLP-dependent transferase [Ignavibacteria bacterium]|nr:PLP-dependent transferase [Ignavibacteria bacterium]